MAEARCGFERDQSSGLFHHWAMDQIVSSRESARSLRFAALFVFALAVGAYHWILPLDFTGLDSGPLIEASRFEAPVGPLTCFAHEVRDYIQPEVGFYRPWTGLSFGMDYLVHGLNARWYHLSDLMLHGAAATTLFLLLLALGAPGWGALLGGAWFAVHPLGVEVVPAVARRADLWVVFLLLLACLAWMERQRGRRGARALLIVAGLLAPLSKETGVILPLLLLVLAGPKERRRALVVGGILVLPALLARTLVLQGLGGYGGWTLQIAPLRAGLGDLIDPVRLAGVWGVRIGVSLLLLLAVLAVLWDRRSRAASAEPPNCLPKERREGATRRLLCFGLSWTFLLLAPAALAKGLSAWYLYAPLAGMSAILTAFISRPPWGKRWSVRVPLVLLGLLCMWPAWLVSPLFVPYYEWHEVSRQMTVWRRVVVELPEEFFEGPQLVAGIPFRVDYPYLRFGRVRSASCLSDFSLRAWTKLLRDRDSDPHAAAFLKIIYPSSRCAVQVSWLPREKEARLTSFGPVQLVLYGDHHPFTIVEHDPDELLLTGLHMPLWRFNGLKLLRVPLPSS
jgi:hypothetical protein